MLNKHNNFKNLNGNTMKNHYDHPRFLRGKRDLWLRAGVVCMLLAAPAMAMQAQQRQPIAHAEANDVPIAGLDKLPGLSATDLSANKLSQSEYTSGKYPTDNKARIFFLYNVKTGLFLNMGSYWGVHTSLKDYPIPFFIYTSTASTQALKLILDVSTSQGNEIKWVNNTANAADQGVYCDRGKNSDPATLAAEGYDGWFFEPVNAADGTNTFRLYTYANSQGSGSKMYLCANIEGEGTSSSALDPDKYCGAFTEDEIKAKNLSAEDGYWRVFSYEQIFNLQDQNTDDMDEPLDLSFKLKCPGFERGRTDREAWKAFVFNTRKDETATMRIGLKECYNQQTLTQSADDDVVSVPEFVEDQYDGGKFQTNTNQDTYQFPYSGSTVSTITSQDDYLRHMGKYFCAEVRGAHGYIFQDQYVLHPGTYVVSAKGYSNTPSAKLFAGIVPAEGHDADDLEGIKIFDEMETGSLHTTTLAQTSLMDATEQARLHVEETNMDYAGKEFYTSYKYVNSVIVQVSEEDVKANANGCRIRFGVMIGDPKANGEPEAGEWTVFDDFHLYYASSTTTEDLVLDENRTDMDYIRLGANNYRNRTLHLAKTFTQNRWNSFVLPVTLSSTQLRSTFGPNVRLAQLKRIEGTEIQFETVDLDQYSTTALQANVPYIIFPTRVMSEDAASAYTATIHYLTGTEGGTVHTPATVVAPKNHFDIPSVTLPTTTDDNQNTVNDLKVDNRYLPELLYATSEDARLVAKGTFVRTFDPGATQTLDDTSNDYGQWLFSNEKGTIREGYPDLTGCYFFDHGDMYYSETKVRGLRGFSCWFEPTDKQLSAAQPTVYLDGVGQQGLLTQIGELLIGDEAIAQSARTRGVYNLMGQRLGDTIDGLPAGLYIVDGVKRVVK